jgi:hypothetical protein
VGVYHDERHGLAAVLPKQPKRVIRVVIGKKDGDFLRRGTFLRLRGPDTQQEEKGKAFFPPQGHRNRHAAPVSAAAFTVVELRVEGIIFCFGIEIEFYQRLLAGSEIVFPYHPVSRTFIGFFGKMIHVPVFYPVAYRDGNFDGDTFVELIGYPVFEVMGKGLIFPFREFRGSYRLKRGYVRLFPNVANDGPVRAYG